LFYLRGVADESIQTSEIYRGVIPFIFIQLLVLITVLFLPFLVL
jgi:TRAP-type mannitol/chloroaromatic compound transport system permease large subunit